MSLKKIFKKVVSIALILILSVDSYAAVVSDNDGSAFITKKEFDALKKSFENQVINYQDSLESKIYGAIASYLAGIKVAKQSHIKLISDIDTVVGSGYRSWNYTLSPLSFNSRVSGCMF